MKKQLLIPFSVLLLLIFGTIAVVMYARGYRLEFGAGKTGISGTGLLVATSEPNGAQVFINDHLTTATDSTINLAPGTYRIRIVKQGYLPWEKTLKIDKELVSKADALLFPSAPKLESITDDGVVSATVDPSGTRIAFTQASGSAQQNGIRVLNMTMVPILTLQSSSKQIANDILDLFSMAMLSWSPDGSEILATVSATVPAGRQATYLLLPTELNNNPQDVTETLISVRTNWAAQKAKKDKSLTNGLKSNLITIISQNFSNTLWSPDETKIAYTASESATLPLIINPRLLGVNATPEQRRIEKGATYVYDIKEDKNYEVNLDRKLLPSAKWLPDSKHILYVTSGQIRSMEFDGTNDTIIYAGPFIDGYVFPWPDGSKIVILTNLNNPQIPPNLYTISLK
ncbi:MAG: PEGA domain-containing protein [Candidatus Levybacteria bacterium]|nr:PEGA domain-containing protein [Candidatus Levybacteria bacterium]